MPNRHSLFWKLAILLVGFCLLMIGLSMSWGRHMETQNAFLSDEARATLTEYAAEAEQAWARGGAAGVDAWLAEMANKEQVWINVLGPDLQSLSSTQLTPEQARRITFLRGIDWPVSRRVIGLPWMRVPFVEHPEQGLLVIELPERLMPGQYRLFWQFMTNGIIPGLFTLLLCVGLYRMLIMPLIQLREQANAWRADQLSARVASSTTSRQDELGELGRAFDDMAERLQGTVALQQQLLRDLSHELRTPLSRLRVASEGHTDVEQLRERLGREVDCMQRLVEDALQLAWQDTERAPMSNEPIQVQALWEMLAEDACFESTWPSAQLQCALDASCWI
ncbi:MAG: histidine kinase sensor domain-containing protein, partial [Pseudomonas sp.]